MFIAQCLENFSASYGLPAGLFLAGLAGGFTHCAGMCGPFVLAQMNADVPQSGTLGRLKGAALWPYHLGRMVSYVGLAIIFYTFLNLAFLFSESRVILSVPMLLLAATLFLLSVFPALSKAFPGMARLPWPVSYALVARLAAPFLNNPDVFRRFVLGVLLGFMPCGMVIAAIMAAGTAQNVGMAALAMAAFALGTVPALVVVGLGGDLVLSRYPAARRWFRQGAMALSALWLFVLAGAMMFL